MEADPDFLSLMEKYTNPLLALQATCHFNGIFCLPDNLRTSDEANPGLFQYTIKFMDFESGQGKFTPRQLTEKQLKEIEDNKKKTTKKGAKAEQEPPKSAVQQQAQRKQRQLWNALSKQEQEIRTYQNPCKSVSIRFQQKEKTLKMESQSLKAFQDAVQQGSLTILLIRKPGVSQDQINKLKKAKPKTLNLLELQPISFRTTFNLQELKKPEPDSSKQNKSSILTSVPADLPRFDFSRTYLHLLIELKSPLFPLVKQVQVRARDFLKERRSGPLKRQKTSSLIAKYKGQIQVALKTISNQYSNLFAKENQEKKISVYSNLKVVDTNKKKDQFLADFSHSGKYKLLLQSMRQSVQKIVLDKWEKQASIFGFDSLQFNHFLAQLQLFLNEQFSQTVHLLMTNRTEQINDDIRFSHEYYQQLKNKVALTLAGQPDEQRFVRISFQHETINQIKEAEEWFQNLILLYPNHEKFLYNYISFCLRHRMFEKAEVLIQRVNRLLELNQLAPHPEHQLLFAALLIRRKRYDQAMTVLKNFYVDQKTSTRHNESVSVISGKHEKQVYKNDNSSLMLISLQLQQFVLEKTNRSKQAQMLRRQIQQIFKRKTNLIGSKASKTQSNPFQFPNYIKTIEERREESKKGIKLNPQQLDELKTYMIQFLAQHNLFDLVEIAVADYKDQQSIRYQLWRTQIYNSKGDFQTAIGILNSIIERHPKNYEVMMLKGDICFNSHKLYESEQIFLRALKFKVPHSKIFSIYLRLGHVYLSRKSWQDAKNIFLKATELKNNSSLSWLGLGKAYKNLKEYDYAQQALNQAKIHDCFNRGVQEQIVVLRGLMGGGRGEEALEG